MNYDPLIGVPLLGLSLGTCSMMVRGTMPFLGWPLTAAQRDLVFEREMVKGDCERVTGRYNAWGKRTDVRGFIF